jgi:hypothetical protein
MKKYELGGLVLIIILACPSVASAYVDPVAGSILLQFLVGGVAGLYCFLKLVKGRVLRRFGIGKGDDKN